MYYSKTQYINNFLSIINIKNFKHNDECQNIIKYNKRKSINEFIKSIGINIFDKSFKITQENLINNFRNSYNTNDLFKSSIYNINKYDFNNINKPKHLVGYINSILSQYCIKLTSNKKTTSVSILYYADEILNNKIQKGYKIHDENNIFHFDNSNIKLKELYQIIYFTDFYKVCKNVLKTISVICLKKYMYI